MTKRRKRSRANPPGHGSIPTNECTAEGVPRIEYRNFDMPIARVLEPAANQRKIRKRGWPFGLMSILARGDGHLFGLFHRKPFLGEGEEPRTVCG